MKDPAFFDSIRCFKSETGYRPLDYTFQTTGAQSICFAVFNVSDIGNRSALLVDDLRIAVPLPAAGGLLAAAAFQAGSSEATECVLC